MKKPNDKIVVRNVPTKNLLLLLAQANAKDCPYVDVFFDTERGAILLSPVTQKQHDIRFEQKDSQDLNIEDIIKNA